jgi:5-(aminomethyl)-3-furanmethanol phosphate kinase
MFGSQSLTPEWVIKVGGSLAARRAPLRRLMTTLAATARRHALVVVPGGGKFADAVREADQTFRLGDSAAHWMAILAMDQYGHLLADLTPGTVLVRSPRELVPHRLNILAPFAWLRDADPLPHSWDVTSDSIAAWIARELGAPRLLLVKHEDGFIPPKHEPRVWSAKQRRMVLEIFAPVVDPYFAQALDPSIGCWFAVGHLPHRIARLIETEGTGAADPGGDRRR